MLSLSKPITVDGVTVYQDHASRQHFWYLPPVVSIARRPGEDVPEFTFLMYKPAVAGAGVKGGGFASFTTTLALPDQLRSRIISRLSAEPGVQLPISLSAPPFDSGTVKVMALNLQGGGGTEATPAAEGSFNAVELIQGATVPSMDEQNRAVFSLTLSQEGAIILEQAFQEGLAPIGVLYSLSYLAMRPALDVEITADFERIYTYFGGHLEGQYLWFQASIDAAFESLRSTGAISIKVVNQTDEADEKEQQKWALDFFKNDLLAKWFEPTLAPGKLLNSAEPDKEKPATGTGTGSGGTGGTGSGGTGGTGSGGTGGGTGGTGSGGTAGTGSGGTGTGGSGTGGSGTGGSGTGGSGSGTSASTGTTATTTTTTTGSAGGNGTTPATPVLQRAALTQTSVQPDPLPSGRAVTHTPAATGTTEVLRITGAGATVTVDGKPATLSATGEVSVDVAAAAQKAVVVSWPAGPAGPAGPAETRTFGLFFNFDKPAEANWKVNPPSPEFRSYVENTTSDPRFRRASGLLRVEGDGDWTGPEEGAERLRSWIASLPAPRAVRLEAFASHEDVTTVAEAQRAAHNLRLSQRRLDVASALVTRAGGTVSASVARGDTVAANRPGSHSPMGGDPDNRVVHVIATLPGAPGAAGTPASTWRGTLARPASVTPNGGGGNGGNGGNGGGDKPTTPKIEVPKPDTAAVKLNLKFVRQEERKILTFRYSSSEAVRRVVAPQGLLGLMLSDLDDTKRIFTKIDLDHSFFREFAVEASAPIDFDPIGLTAAQLTIDYGDPNRPAEHKHGELRFSADDQGPKTFTTFLNDRHEVDYDAKIRYDFDPQSGWAADAFSYTVLEPDTEKRTQVLNPFEHVEFRTLTFEPGDIDWEIVSSIDVLLEASGYAQPEPHAQLKLTPTSGPQSWRLRGALPVPAGRQVTYVLRQNLVDGTSESTEPRPADLPVVAVNDLFTGALNLVFVPGFAPGSLATVFVDVEYHDPIHHYDRVFRHEVPGTTTVTDPVRVRVALRDPDQREYRYRLTFVGPDGSLDRRAWETTSEQLVSLR